MEKLYENMIILENHLDAYEQKCQLYWNNIGRWQPKAKDFFKLAKAFKRLAYYKPQRLLDLEERARLGDIQSMMAAMAALIETCALCFPLCTMEEDLGIALSALRYWLVGNKFEEWDENFEQNIFTNYNDAFEHFLLQDYD